MRYCQKFVKLEGVDVFFLILYLLVFVASLLPLFSTLEMVTTTFENASVQDYRGLIVTQISFGVSEACIYDHQHKRTCPPNTPVQYNVTLTGNETKVNIEATDTFDFYFVSFVCTGVACLAMSLLYVCADNFGMTGPAILLLFPVVFTMVSFFKDYKFFKHVQHEMARLGEGIVTKPGLGYWFTLGSLCLLIVIFILEFACHHCFLCTRERYYSQAAAAES